MKLRNFIITVIVFLISSINVYADTIDLIVAGAYAEIKNETKYNTDMLEKYYPPKYENGKNTGKAVYPNGDVHPDEGVCSDLVVRALRNAGIDLQAKVHADILTSMKAYGVESPDKYIDQRRVWILKTYFTRNWENLTTKLEKSEEWQSGDVVIWDIGSKKHLHTGIIGNKKRKDGFPFVIHNMRYMPFVLAGKTIEQDILEGPEILWFSVGSWKITGHYRFKK